MTTMSRVLCPPVTCQPWCEQQNGHPDCVLRDDQICFGPDREVPISGEPLLGWRAFDHRVEPQILRAYAAFDHLNGAVCVQVGHNDEPGSKLTPEEARIFAEALLAAVAEINGAG